MASARFRTTWKTPRGCKPHGADARPESLIRLSADKVGEKGKTDGKGEKAEADNEAAPFWPPRKPGGPLGAPFLAAFPPFLSPLLLKLLLVVAGFSLLLP